jgi:general secretion pathway protein K
MNALGRPQRIRITAQHQRGSALLLAMVIMTLVVTLAAGMIWQHARAIQIESAERARAQSAWMLNGALDWAGLIVREDLIKSTEDHLGEPWAVPLAEARLTTFLAADRSGVADADAVEDAPDAFLSGAITDAQARWNLRNLIGQDGKVVLKQFDALQRLCDKAGVPGGTAQLLADNYHAAWLGGERAPVMPAVMRDLPWLGIDRAVVAQLGNFITLLPTPTKLNINTASAEVMAAVLDAPEGLAQGLVETRKRAHFKNAQAALKGTLKDEQLAAVGNDIDVKTDYFEVRGRMRLDDRVLEEMSIVRRQGRVVTPVHRERINYVDTAAAR